MYPVRIRWRLTWYGVGFTAVVLVGIISLLGVLISGSATNDQEALLSAMADQAAAGLSTTDVHASEPVVSPGVPDADTSDQPFLTVYDDSGSILFATGTVGGEPLELPRSVVAEATTTGSGSASYAGVRSEVRAWNDPSRASGVVAASQSERVVATQLLGARWFMVVFGVIALLAASVGAWFMAGRALRPLKALADTTDRIGSTGDLSARLPDVEQDDEVGALTSSFNAMIGGLETARVDRDRTIEAQKRFVADASHELRSPLTSIRANAGFLAEHDNASPDDRIAAISDIHSEAERMSGLIDGLLTLARADRLADQAADFRAVDLVEIVRAVAARARNLPLRLELELPERAVVRGHEDELAEMVWILIDNADKHGGGLARIKAEAGDGSVVVSIADDGPGIPESDLDRVFDRFHRSDQARSGPGHGLGLAMARAIVLRHGGSIGASNSPSGGAVFSVVFPIGDS